jgi:hypothetical protein
MLAELRISTKEQKGKSTHTCIRAVSESGLVAPNPGFEKYCKLGHGVAHLRSYDPRTQVPHYAPRQQNGDEKKGEVQLPYACEIHVESAL